MLVLIVDDSRDNADMLAALIESRGHSARVAYTGKTAMQLIENQSYDVAFFDHNMPVVTGLDLVKAVKKDGRKTWTVIMSGEETITETYEDIAGADDYLVKPFSSRVVDEILKKYQTAK